MKNITFALSFFFFLGLFGSAGDAQVPSVQILAKKGGFLSSKKYAEIALSNQNKVVPLTSDNVNAGKYFYFLCKTVGDWTFDADFVKDNLPKLAVQQGDQNLRVIWKEELPKDGSKTLAVGFSKSLQLHQPFMVKMEIGDEPNEQEFRVPEDYWPGYSLLTSLCSRAESLANVKQFKEAIHVYERILQSNELKIFPRFGKISKSRSQQFGNFFDETLHSFVTTVSLSTLAPRDKMNQIDAMTPEFLYVVDSLPNLTYQVSSSDSGVSSLTGFAKDALLRAKSYRDSLQSAYDKQNMQWIIDGNLAGENAYKYQHIIPILASAFSSLDFGNDTASTLHCTLSDDMQGALLKYNLTEPYQSFIRVCSDRLRRKMPLFPGDFIVNLRHGGSAFPLPYASMLKAIDDFYKKDFASSKNELKEVFRSCDNPDLLPRYHQLRILLDTKLAPVPPVVITLLLEARQAESRNDESGVLDRYQQAIRMAPTFAYPAYALGQYYLNAGSPIRAIPFFERAYQIDSTFLPAYREEYKFYQKTGSYQPMIQILTQALQKGNDYWEISYNLGQAYMGAADPGKAVQSFEHALSLNPKSYLTTVSLGLAYQAIKNYLGALQYFNKAIEIDPENPAAVEYRKVLDDQMKGAH